jgi:hypothetical protein
MASEALCGFGARVAVVVFGFALSPAHYSFPAEPEWTMD